METKPDVRLSKYTVHANGKTCLTKGGKPVVVDTATWKAYVQAKPFSCITWCVDCVKDGNLVEVESDFTVVEGASVKGLPNPFVTVLVATPERKRFVLETEPSDDELADQILGPRAHPIATMKTLRSQKARGVQVLAKVSLAHGLTTWAASRTLVLTAGSGVEPPTYPTFARPCPERPRHGFVDSRVVHDRSEWLSLMAEIEACDEPTCEVMLMPPIEADWSAIVTPSGITMGTGNDGATSGHGSVSVPAPTRPAYLRQHYFGGKELEELGITDTPYIEVVHDAENVEVEVVQVRDGPAITVGDRWVPKQVTVGRVVKVDGQDLMAWEEEAKGFDAGTVVWHPGGNLSSHYSVHCIINKVPVVCTEEEVRVGDVLEPSGVEADLDARQYVNLASLIPRFMSALRSSKEDRGVRTENVRIAVATLHANAAWGPQRHLVWMRAFMAASLVHHGTLACIGENRHWPGGSDADVKRYADGIPFAGRREDSYRFALDMHLEDVLRQLRYAHHDYDRPVWSGGYGGPKWHDCTREVLRGWKAIAQFLREPNESGWVEVVQACNAIVNTSHNGGRLLTKFLDSDEFDSLAMDAGIGFLNTQSWLVLAGEFGKDGDGWSTHEVATIVAAADVDETPAWLEDRMEAVLALQGGWTDEQIRFGEDMDEEEEDMDEEDTDEEVSVTPAQPVDTSALVNVSTDGEALEGKAYYDGGYRIVGGGVKVQVMCPSVNRPYGASFLVEVATDVHHALLEDEHGGLKSVSHGSDKVYTPAKFGFDDDGDVWMETADGTLYLCDAGQFAKSIKAVG
jgi:hypothetical protein